MNLKLVATGYLILSVNGYILSCGHSKGQSDSSVNYMDQAKRVSTGNIRPDDKEVVVYYANETDPTDEALKNFNSIISALKAQPQTHAMAVDIESDKVKFGSLVDAEISVLSARLCSQGNKTGGGLIVFDNRYARQGKYRYCEAGQALKTVDSKDAATMLAASKGDYRIKSHPLMSGAGLSWALKQVSQAFPGKAPLLSLIVRSHGFDQGEVLLSPRMTLRYDQLSGNDQSRTAEVQAYALKGLKANQAATAKQCGINDVARILDKSSFEKTGTMDKSSSTFDKTGTMDKSSTSFDKGNAWFATIGDLVRDNPGLTKKDFIQVLSQSGFRYGIVATLSCKSSWSKYVSQGSSLPIEWLVGADEIDGGIPYETLDFNKFLNNYPNTPGTKIANALKDYLNQESNIQKSQLNAKKANQCKSLKQ